MNLRSYLLIAVSAFLIAPVAAQEVRGVTDTEIKLGTHTDLSGPSASSGTTGVNGMRMRFGEVNAAGGVHGRKITFIVEDAQYQVPKALQAANKLINRDGIFLMVGANGTAMNIAVLNDSQLAAGVPNMFPFAMARQLQEPLSPLKWGAVATFYDNMRLATKYMVEEKKHSKICAMYIDSDFGKEIIGGITDQLKVYNMQVVAETKHRPTDTDFTASLIRLRDAGCDAILLGSIVRDTIAIYSTARQMNWNVDMAGANPLYDQSLSAVAGGVTEGLVSFHSFISPEDDKLTPEAKAWKEEYVKLYGVQPNTLAQLGWLFADLVVKGLEGAGPDLTLDSFVKAMEQIKDYQDIFGDPAITFGPDKHYGTNMSFMSVVKDGKWVQLRDASSYE